jgi:hypothetical protein
MKTAHKLTMSLLLMLALCIAPGCREKRAEEHAAKPQKHEHKPPHGGTPVVLGDEEYHIELVLDAATGKMLAYVFDGELENFVRIANETFQVEIKTPPGPLVFKAVPNTATGETVGNTSLFEVQSDWLKANPNFDAVLKTVTVKGKKYENIPFNFPKGNDTDEK